MRPRTGTPWTAVAPAGAAAVSSARRRLVLRATVLSALLLCGPHATVQAQTAALTWISDLEDPTYFGTQANDDSYDCSLSSDGQRVVFTSRASNLVAGDTNAAPDVFVRHRGSGTIQRITGPGGAQLATGAIDGHVSADGRTVVFVTGDPLDPDDIGSAPDIYALDLLSGALELISVGSEGVSAGGSSPWPSTDARLVVFDGQDSGLPGGSTVRQVYLRDRDAGTTILASRTAGGAFAGGNGASQYPRLIGDRFVAFESLASDLAASDTNGVRDVFTFDRTTENVRRMSRSTPAAQLPSASFLAGGGLDGGVPRVFFRSVAQLMFPDTNGLGDVLRVRIDGEQATLATPDATGGWRVSGDLDETTSSGDARVAVWSGGDGAWDAGDLNGNNDIFAATVGAGAVRISRTITGLAPDGWSGEPCADGDGSTIAFETAATDIVALDRNRSDDVVVCEGTPCLAELASRATSTIAVAAARDESYSPEVSADGRFTVFTSESSVLTGSFQSDASAPDVYLFDRNDGSKQLLTPGATSGGSPAVSADGRYVAFSVRGHPGIPASTFSQIVLLDRNTGAVVLVSRTPAGAPGNAGSSEPTVSDDGSLVAFLSDASDLASGDANGTTDVFLFRRSTGTVQRISSAVGGANAGNGASEDARIAGEGRYVVFASRASDLVAGDGNGFRDIFLHDRATLTTARIAQPGAGAESDSNSTAPDVSDDGRWIVFESQASNLGGVDANGNGEDVFLFDRINRTTLRLGARFDGAPAGAADRFHAPRISGDGQRVAYLASLVAAVLPGASNPLDVFNLPLLGSRSPGDARPMLGLLAGGMRAAQSSRVALDRSGQQLALSSSDDLVAGDVNGESDIYLAQPPVGVDGLFADGFEPAVRSPAD